MEYYLIIVSSFNLKKKKKFLKHITNLIVGRKYLEKSVRTSVVIILLSDMCNR